MKTIVYESNTGFTKQYAEMLAQKINCSAYSLSEAKKHINKTDEVFFMGWIFGTKIQGLKKARKKFNVTKIAAVGITEPDSKYVKELAQKNKINGVKLYYLQGGMDKNKLKGIKAKLINLLAKEFEKDYEMGKLKKDDKQALKIFKNGANFVKEENLAKILREW